MPPAPLCGRWPISRARLFDMPRPIISSSARTCRRPARSRRLPWRATRAAPSRQGRARKRTSVPLRLIGEHQGDVVPRRRVRRGAGNKGAGLLATGNGRQLHARHACRRRKAAPSRVMRLAVHAADSAPSTPKIGIAAGEVGVALVGAPDRQRPRRLAQHEKTGGVIDLPVRQHDAGDGACRAAGAPAAAPGWPSAARGCRGRR